MRERLRGGAPWIVVLGTGLAAIVALLAVAALRGNDSPRGFASLRATDGSCTVDATRSRDVVGCVRTGPGVYRVTFSRSVEGRAAVATRETCCPGQVLAAVDSARSVLVALPGERNYPVVLSVLVP